MRWAPARSRAARAKGPFAYAIPPDQHDPAAAARLVNLLAEGGVEVQQASEGFKVGDTVYPAGTAFVLMAQPFRAYAKSLLSRSSTLRGSSRARRRPSGRTTSPDGRCPFRWACASTRSRSPSTRRSSRGSIAWASRRRIPLGYPKADYYLVDARGNAGAIAANRLLAAGLQVEWSSGVVKQDGFTYAPGTLIVRPVKDARPTVERLARELGLRVFGARGKPPASTPVARARVALYRPWTDAIDEGWTRWLLEQYEFPFTTLRDAEVRAGGLKAAYDVIILPSIAAPRLIEGNPKGSLPEEYVGGLGAAGVAALKAFVEAGGTLVCLDAVGAARDRRPQAPGEERRAGAAA